MKNTIREILSSYLEIFPQEQERLSILMKYLETNSDEQIVDWNNFEGHIVAGGFIYAMEEKKFLVLHHKDLDMYLYPGGHVDPTDKTPLEASNREVKEETGLRNLRQLTLVDNPLIPIDIDTHRAKYNQRLNLPEHYHFDFRYMYIIDKIENIKIDTEEASDYKWISIDELSNDHNYGKVTTKIEQLLSIKKIKRTRTMGK